MICSWERNKSALEIAKLAYIIQLDFSNWLPDDIFDILQMLMIMEADDCLILKDTEIDDLIHKLKSFYQSL